MCPTRSSRKTEGADGLSQVHLLGTHMHEHQSLRVLACRSITTLTGSQSSVTKIIHNPLFAFIDKN